MSGPEVSRLVSVLMACYPGVTFPPGTVAAYEGFLLELDHERAQAAIKQVIRASKFLPSIAEIVAAYDALAPPVRSTYPRYLGPKHTGAVMTPAELKAEIDRYLAEDDDPPAPLEDFS